MAITDLTNTTWTFKDSGVNYPSGYSSSHGYAINFTVSGLSDNSFQGVFTPAWGLDTCSATVMALNTAQTGGIVYLKTTEEVYINYNLSDGEGWYLGTASGGNWDSLTKMSSAPTITITGGTDVTNSELIAWLEENTVQEADLTYLKPITLENLATFKQIIIDSIYPIGSIYMSVLSDNPNTLFPGTYWNKIENAFLYGSGTKSLGATGGEETHTLSVGEMPAHEHVENWVCKAGSDGAWTVVPLYRTTGGSGWGKAISTIMNGLINDNSKWATNDASGTITTQGSGSGSAHNNMPPYLVVNIWKRVTQSEYVA